MNIDHLMTHTTRRSPTRRIRRVVRIGEFWRFDRVPRLASKTLGVQIQEGAGCWELVCICLPQLAPSKRRLAPTRLSWPLRQELGHFQEKRKVHSVISQKTQTFEPATSFSEGGGVLDNTS